MLELLHKILFFRQRF